MKRLWRARKTLAHSQWAHCAPTFLGVSQQGETNYFKYVPLMAEGIILFSTDNLWTQKLDRSRKYWPHGVLLGISIAAVTAGISAEIHRKRQSGRSHFVSDHAITGLVSWILAFLAIFLGSFSWHAQRLRGLARPVLFKFVHNFLGVACYAIGIASLCLGLEMGHFANRVTETEKQVTIALVGVITCWSLLAAFKSCYNQLKTIFT
ncbi:hypothetical protein NQ317_017588 [Molorchus minor]|uniref:ascorbate ferrireductase (transmembrane) n=1 Tax=Molorchus minor TaxID=1323400 RepID=A0ABQ9JTG0_9CUCU|nr:hypothetical protein NQ317_017588 [Molorchus minor]